MDTELLRTGLAILGCATGVAGFMFGLYQYRKAQNTVAPVDRREEVRNSIMVLLARIDSSYIVTVVPTSEHWVYGFESLKDLRSLSAATSVLTSTSSHVPRDIQDVMAGILERIRSVTIYHDTLHDLAKGEHLSLSDYDRWEDKAKAEAALAKMQAYISTNDGRLRAYLSELHGK